MIDYIRKAIIKHRILWAQIDEQYWLRGVVAAEERANGYQEKAEAAFRKQCTLRQRYTDIEHPIRSRNLFKGA